MTEAAKPSDWEIDEMVSGHSTFALDRLFPGRQMKRIRLGVIPEQMEDKWFIYWLDDALYFHRSWTGLCAFIVRFAAEGKGSRMISAKAHRAPGEDNETRDPQDAAMISYLIDALLLHVDAPFPSDEEDPDARTIANWSAVGRAMLGDHPTRE
jgi:8-oxo-dGTP diphosphatase